VSGTGDVLFVPSTDQLLANNARYVESFAHDDLALRPRRKLAVVARMDSRMDIFQLLGLAHGDAHIIRNAWVVTDDVIRSPARSVGGDGKVTRREITGRDLPGRGRRSFRCLPAAP
jgi:hypothetical protein